MAELHSITGLFFEDVHGASPFGGYYIRKNENLGRREIEGQLADIWGISAIKGEMHPGLLSFTKQYRRCNHEQAFDYTFTFKNGIWEGEYISPVTGYNGKSICKTIVCMRNLNAENINLYSPSNSRSPEEFAREMIEGLIKKDLIRKVKEPKPKKR